MNEGQPGGSIASYDVAGVEAAFDSVVDGVLVVDADGVIVFANAASERIFGYRQDELVGQAVEGLVPAPLRAGHRDHRHHYGTGPSARPMGVGMPLQAVRKDGTVFPVEISLAPLVTPDGTYTTAVARDVTEVRDRERRSALRLRSEAHLALSQRVARMGSWEHDLGTGEMSWSAELHELLGIPEGSVTPSLDLLYRAVHPEDRSQLRAEVVRARREGGELFAEVRLGTHAPRTVAVLGTVELAGGRPVRSIGTVQDVTSRTALEAELRASDHRFRVAFDRAPIGLALVDARPGRPPTLLMANAALSEMTGVPQEELLARSALDLVERPPGSDGYERLRSGELDSASVEEARLLRPDGAERWVSVIATVVRDADGTPDYLVTHVIDITNRKQAEAQTRERAARDGRIAAVLQEGLMPYVPQQVGPVRAASRYRPAGHGETVGGDWSDVLALPGGRIGMVVGDVAGHGIESAATMTRLRTVVRMLATSGVSPAGVMRRLNDVMHESDMDGDIDLATLVHAQFEPATGTLVYSSAGHLPLLLVEPDAVDGHRPVSPVPAVGGPPIGVIPGLRYTEQALHLQPGSTLIGFTDGLIERRGDDLDASLLHLLADLGALPAAVTGDVERLADAVLALSPGPDAEDDVAVIVLGLEPGAVPAAPGGTARQGHVIDLADVARPPQRWA